MSRSATDIGRVLDKLMAKKVPVIAFFPSVTFQSLLLMADQRAGRIVLARSTVEAANQALLARPRCTFHCEMAGWHVEFIAAEPRAVLLQRKQVIQCRFPEILASNQRRETARVAVKPPLPLRVEADSAGIMPFDGLIVDVGPGGVGFFVYASSITLEPGTVLRGCLIQLPGGKSCESDVEVRYSQSITLANGRRATRSGCRFIDPAPELAELIRQLLAR